MTAARVTLGAICLSSSGHFAHMLYSNSINPVVLPLGRAKLATKPRLIGSVTATNTIGTVRLACCSAPTAVPPTAMITSGESATNSGAYLR
ncbi:MAG TPA: hypothetical protein VF852_14000 [Pseudolabrys sp.]